MWVISYHIISYIVYRIYRIYRISSYRRTCWAMEPTRGSFGLGSFRSEQREMSTLDTLRQGYGIERERERFVRVADGREREIWVMRLGRGCGCELRGVGGVREGGRPLIFEDI